MPTAATRPARPCGYPSHLRARGPRLCARPRGSRCPVTAGGGAPARSTGSPTVMIGFCCLEEITHRLHRTCAKCGKPASAQARQVIHRWFGCGEPGVKPVSWSTALGDPQVFHRCPPVVHRLSTGFLPSAVDEPGHVIPRTFNRPFTGRPSSVDNRAVVPRRPQPFPRACPQSVGNRAGTLRGCPPAVTQGLWTTGASCGRTRRRSCALDRVEGQARSVAARRGPAARRPNRHEKARPESPAGRGTAVLRCGT